MRGDLGGRLRLSVLDHTPVLSGSTLAEAFWHSTRLAELAKQVAYERYWVAEHHNMPWLASSSPAVLVATVAHHTKILIDAALIPVRRLGRYGLLVARRNTGKTYLHCLANLGKVPGRRTLLRATNSGFEQEPQEHHDQ